MGRGRGDELIPTVVVLTGGIGTGKSLAAAFLEARGAQVIHSDRLGHAVLEPGGPAYPAVAERWPETVVDGRIDRRALGRIVFTQPGDLAELEAITHPEIRRLLWDALEESESEVVVVEIPIPAPWLDPSWRTVVVDVGEELRRERLLSRGMSDAEITARMEAQPTREEWLALADEVVPNEGDEAALEAVVDRLWASITSPSG